MGATPRLCLISELWLDFAQGDVICGTCICKQNRSSYLFYFSLGPDQVLYALNLGESISCGDLQEQHGNCAEAISL